MDRKTLDLRTERHGDVLSVDVSGQIDNTTIPGFEKAVRKATKENRPGSDIGF